MKLGEIKTEQDRRIRLYYAITETQTKKNSDNRVALPASELLDQIKDSHRRPIEYQPTHHQQRQRPTIEKPGITFLLVAE